MRAWLTLAIVVAASACDRAGATPDGNGTPVRGDAGIQPSPLVEARQLRFDAGDALDKQDWKTALDLFDHAKALDPAGEGVPWIVNGRALAHDGLSRAVPVSPEP